MRKVHELRSRGVTILFVSHSMGDVKAIGDRTMWLDHGHIRELGATDAVVSKYLAAMSEKDSSYLELKRPSARPAFDGDTSSRMAPEIVRQIPNVDHRHGDRRAEIIGIGVCEEHGAAVHMLQPDTRVVVRISVRANEAIAQPNVGFMLRNHMGVDFAGTNNLREGVELPPMRSGDIYTVDFHLDIPGLYPSHFSFSPAIADGTLLHYKMCDWIDNALTLQMSHGEAPVYGYLHLPCRVEVNGRLGGTSESRSSTRAVPKISIPAESQTR
jgi:ABC-type glutathione transport system ATPase component